jgi:hypothetical protein
MKALNLSLGWPFGLRFAEDNHVVPVLRWDRYDRVEGPGFFWINPLMEKTLPPVKTGIYVGNFIYDKVLTKEGVPFRVHMTVLFNFNPGAALKNAAAVLVRAGPDLLEMIVKDYASQGLRSLASQFEADKLYGEARSIIARDLAQFLTAEMSVLGIAPLKRGGILIKETVAPAKFERAILNARQLNFILQALAPFPMPWLIELVIRAVFTTNLEDNNPVVITPALAPSEGIASPYLLDIQELLRQHNGISASD